MINRIKKIIVSKAGFSITETLVAMLIMLMVSSVVVGGIPVAQRAYQKVTEGANAQVLLSTTITELRNEIALASDISVIDSGKALQYQSGANGSARKLYVDDTEGIKLQTIPVETLKNIPVSGTQIPTPSPRLLVTDEAASKNLVVKFTGVDTTTKGIVKLSNLSVTRRNESDPLISLSELDIDLVME